MLLIIAKKDSKRELIIGGLLLSRRLLDIEQSINGKQIKGLISLFGKAKALFGKF
jgi:hypothetical protein